MSVDEERQAAARPQQWKRLERADPLFVALCGVCFRFCVRWSPSLPVCQSWSDYPQDYHCRTSYGLFYWRNICTDSAGNFIFSQTRYDYSGDIVLGVCMLLGALGAIICAAALFIKMALLELLPRAGHLWAPWMAQAARAQFACLLYVDLLWAIETQVDNVGVSWILHVVCFAVSCVQCHFFVRGVQLRPNGASFAGDREVVAEAAGVAVAGVPGGVLMVQQAQPMVAYSQPPPVAYGVPTPVSPGQLYAMPAQAPQPQPQYGDVRVHFGTSAPQQLMPPVYNAEGSEGVALTAPAVPVAFPPMVKPFCGGCGRPRDHPQQMFCGWCGAKM